MADINNVNVREMVVEMLLEVVRMGTHSHILLKQVTDKYNYINEADKAWIKRVFEGTLEREITLDYVLNKYSNTPVNKMKPYIRCLMRMSVYQLLYMDRVPDSAAINEAVKLAKKHKFVNLSGFVNGVLRKVASNKDYCIDTTDISVIYSTPQFIVDSFINDYGQEKAEEILKGFLEERHLFVRIREDISGDDRQAVVDEWERNNIQYIANIILPYAYELKNTENLGRLECFQKGLYTVQDVASMLVCERAGIKPGDKVIDVCAAPGGKSLHAVSKGAIVDARDVSDRKVALINENIDRLNAEKNIAVKVWDATVSDSESFRKADIVIADVPCSGLGVMGKKPDIKRNVTVEGWESIVALQQEIVDTVINYVKPGGTLMYSTCTLRKAENEEQVERIINTYPDFSLESMETLFPCKDYDGFFIAKLKRN